MCACKTYVNPAFPKGQILESLKLKKSANDNSKFYENGENFSQMVENTVGKGEIACYEQFLHSPQCFQKSYTAQTLKQGLVWERVSRKSETLIGALDNIEIEHILC